MREAKKRTEDSVGAAYGTTSGSVYTWDGSSMDLSFSPRTTKTQMSERVERVLLKLGDTPDVRAGVKTVLDAHHKQSGGTVYHGDQKVAWSPDDVMPKPSKAAPAAAAPGRYGTAAAVSEPTSPRAGTGDERLIRQAAVDNALAVALGEHRARAMRLVYTARRDGWNVELIEQVLVDFADQVEHFRTSWAQAKVDGDRRERQAYARALDCTEHGHVIDGLEKQLTAADRFGRSADRSRREYIAGVHNLVQAVDRIRKRVADGDTDGIPDLPDFLDTLAGYLDSIQQEARWR